MVKQKATSVADCEKQINGGLMMHLGHALLSPALRFITCGLNGS
jgi:hypothetical protein